MLSSVFSQVFLDKPLVGSDADSSASTVCETCEDEILHLSLDGHKDLNLLYRDLKKKGGATHYKNIKSLHFSFKTDPTRKLSNMKHLSDVFATLGSLPKLEEVTFADAVLFLPSLSKFFRQTSSLSSIKFHHCMFILAEKKSDFMNEEQAVNKLWNGIQLQKSLAVLEIVDCHYNLVQKLYLRAANPKFTFQIPAFLQEEQCLPSLQRLVLDECIINGSDHTSFANLLTNNVSLKQLQIRPAFEVTAPNRRQQYQVKKQAIWKFMTHTIPSALASADCQLEKLIVSLDDYHLEQVYEETMISWIELVEHDNSTLTDMAVTHLPLFSNKMQEDAEDSACYEDSCLHDELQCFLKLNQFSCDA